MLSIVSCFQNVFCRHTVKLMQTSLLFPLYSIQVEHVLFSSRLGPLRTRSVNSLTSRPVMPHSSSLKTVGWELSGFPQKRLLSVSIQAAPIPMSAVSVSLLQFASWLFPLPLMFLGTPKINPFYKDRVHPVRSLLKVILFIFLTSLCFIWLFFPPVWSRRKVV